MGQADRPEPSALLKRAHVFVSGRVQGVFFRATAAREASKCGLAGWVRNLPDGRVEAVFQGPAAAVEEVVRWCGTGPPMASVDAVEVTWEEPRESERSFVGT